MSTNNAIRTAVRNALYFGALTTAAGYAPLAGAQGADEAIEEIVVTGTRIQRQDYQSASPIVSLSAETFEQTGIVNAEELINTLPQIVPSFSAGNNNPGNGQAWINLRGLGSVRNLVLIDGKRPTPSNEDAIVDINTIPVAMLERVRAEPRSGLRARRGSAVDASGPRSDEAGGPEPAGQRHQVRAAGIVDPHPHRGVRQGAPPGRRQSFGGPGRGRPGADFPAFRAARRVVRTVPRRCQFQLYE